MNFSRKQRTKEYLTSLKLVDTLRTNLIKTIIYTFNIMENKPKKEIVLKSFG